jgi:hypothetical protein
MGSDILFGTPAELVGNLTRFGVPSVNVSRATFLKASCLALLGARVDARTLLPALATPQTPPTLLTPSNRHDTKSADGGFRVQDATAAAFLPHVNTSFAVRSAKGAGTRLELMKVVEQPATKHVEQFSLVFHAQGGATLADGTHAVRHPALGAFDLFIAPIGGSNRRRRVYEACFTRRIS